MNKRVLIFSDNPYLCKQFNQIVSKKCLHNIDFEYAVSPSSRVSDFSPIFPLTINLKFQKDIEQLILGYQMIISLHCKQLFPRELVNSVKCINVHPGYNPINRGWFPQVFSIINELPIGATIHEINEELDNGDIITREFVNIDSTDTSLSLYNKIISKEIELIEKYIEEIVYETYTVFKPESIGNLYLKKDFIDLCKLDLDETMTVKECINRLRALTHGDYNNCYFIDSESGKKIFVKILLKEENLIDN